MKKSVPLWAVIVIVLIAVLAVVIFATQKPSAPPANGGAVVPSQTEGGAVAPNQAEGGAVAQITEEQAKEIALEKAGLTTSDVRFERVEKDYENGILVYEVEFYKGRVEYSAEVSASDGKIISWEIDAD